MKPNGLALTVGSGGLRMSVSQPTRTEDAIWEAVESAINEGWDARRFRDEAAEAWADRLKQDAKDAAEIFDR